VARPVRLRLDLPFGFHKTRTAHWRRRAKRIVVVARLKLDARLDAECAGAKADLGVVLFFLRRAPRRTARRGAGRLILADRLRPRARRGLQRQRAARRPPSADWWKRSLSNRLRSPAANRTFALAAGRRSMRFSWPARRASGAVRDRRERPPPVPRPLSCRGRRSRAPGSRAAARSREDGAKAGSLALFVVNECKTRMVNGSFSRTAESPPAPAPC
jgi:hypothetical protein